MSRKDYYIKPSIGFDFEKEMIAILPTIIIQPYIYRPLGVYVIEIFWLMFHIGIGTWSRRVNND